MLVRIRDVEYGHTEYVLFCALVQINSQYNNNNNNNRHANKQLVNSENWSLY